MDQKALSHLDPKARETYDRVMNAAATTENPVQNTPAPDMQQNFQADVPSAAPEPPQSVPMPAAPSDLTMLAPTPEAVPAPPVPTNGSIFSASPVTTESQTTSAAAGDFFSNPNPGTLETAPAAPSPFAPISPEAPADTSMATDTLSPLTPVTPYTPASQEIPNPMSQPAAEPQPLQSPAAALQKPRETSALIKVLYIIGAVVFFAIYTIFWIKVFKLPFLF